MSSFDEDFDPYRASDAHDEMDARFGWELRNNEVHHLNREREILRAAICQTLDANGHLADGEVCTLLALKKALRKVGAPWAGDVAEDLSQCPRCGGEADNGHDRCLPPSAYLCGKCSELHNVEVQGPGAASLRTVPLQRRVGRRTHGTEMIERRKLPDRRKHEH